MYVIALKKLLEANVLRSMETFGKYIRKKHVHNFRKSTPYNTLYLNKCYQCLPMIVEFEILYNQNCVENWIVWKSGTF